MPGDHQSTTSSAFTNYTGHYCDGVSNVVWTGTWKRVKVESIIDKEDNYTWDYQVKILHKFQTDYTVDETATNYNVTASVDTDETFSDEDADWGASSIALTSLSVAGDTDGKELYITVGSPLASPFTSGTYTRD